MKLSPGLHDLLALQGEIKMKLFLGGVPEGRADELAAEILHLVVTTPIATPEYRAAYEALSTAQAP